MHAYTINPLIVGHGHHFSIGQRTYARMSILLKWPFETAPRVLACFLINGLSWNTIFRMAQKSVQLLEV